MREPDLDSINESVASTLEDGKVVMISWIRNDLVQESQRHIGRFRCACNEDEQRVEVGGRTGQECWRKEEGTEGRTWRKAETGAITWMTLGDAVMACQHVRINRRGR